MATPVKSPLKGIESYGHFPKNFLQPYGTQFPPPEEEVIFTRIKTHICEWLIRPEVAFSEMADTIKAGMDTLTTTESNLVQPHVSENMKSQMSSLLAWLDLFNKKGTSDHKPQCQDLKRLPGQQC